MQIASLNINRNHAFLNDGTMAYLLPEIRLVSELQRMDTKFTETGCEYVFKIFLTYGVNFEMGFDCALEAAHARQDIIINMMKYWGPDHIILSNGTAYDITVSEAVMDMTDVFQKDGYACFSLQIEGVPYPVNLVFPDANIANRARSEINDKIEFRRIQKANSCLFWAAANL